MMMIKVIKVIKVIIIIITLIIIKMIIFFNDDNNENEEIIKENEKMQSFKNPTDILENYKKEKEKYKDKKIGENEYYEHFLKHILDNAIKNLLCDDVYEEIITEFNYYRKGFNKDWNKQKRRFFLLLIITMRKIYYIFMMFKMKNFIRIIIMIVINFTILMRHFLISI
jgi:hypothetical protein